MVYIDSYRAPFGRMKMSHLMADTTDELLTMVDKIGVARKWIQKAGMPDEHFDIAESKRKASIKAGAKVVSSRELILMIRFKRA